MNRFGASTPLGWGTRTAILTIGWLLIACGLAGGVGAQFIPFDETAADVGSKFRDYYARGTDPATENRLRAIEKYHLADSFWQAYREGRFNSVRADLEFVFAYFPNHPKALHLIAYDKNLNIGPSQVIQQFETAIRAFPTRAYTYAQYGRYLISIGRRNIGVELLDEALRLDPSLLVARAWRAEGESTQPPSEAEPPGGAGGNREPSTNSKR